MDNSTNDVSVEDETEMAECDGEPVVTMMDVLKEQQEFEEDANAVLGASDDKNCTFSKGYIKRQAVYACLTCCSDAKFDPTKRAGVCLACSLNCHESHELVELYTKRNFRCDCGNPKFNNHPCHFTPNKNELNEDNKYNQNFSGLYCICHRPYPDPDSSVEDEMIQCIICEDWLHASHLDAVVPSNDQYAEMICKGCMDKNEFLHDYSCYSVNTYSEDEEVNVDVHENDISKKACNGILTLDTSETNEVVEAAIPETESNKELNEAESELNEIDVDQATETIKNSDETKISDEIQTLPTFDEDHENKDINTLDTDNELCNTNDTNLTKDFTELKNKDDEVPVIDKNKQDTNDSSKIDEMEKVDMVSIKAFTQNETSEKNESVEKVSANEMTAIANNILPDDTNEEIMSEIDKILGSPHDLESNASELEKHNMLQTTPTEKEQNFDASEVKNNEITTRNENAENESDTRHIDETSFLNKESCVESEDAINRNDFKNNDKEKSSDIETKGQEETNDAFLENKNAINSEDKLEESLLNENCENSNYDKLNSIQKSVTHVHTNENSNKEGCISSIELNVENVDKNSTVTCNDTEGSSKIEQPMIEDDSYITTPNQEIDALGSNAKSEADNIDNETHSKHTYERNSKTNSDSQINESSLDTPTSVIPVITEINSVSENNEQADQSEPFNENKRKLALDESEIQFSNKKLKINHDEKPCQRPKNAKRKLKGATFWSSEFRQKLCTCNECLTMYKELSVLFLTDPEDTVTAYEALGQAKTRGTPTQYEKGLEALSSLDRTLQINALTEYNKLRDKFLDFLKGFKDRKEIVKEEDIKMFFAELKPRKESDGIYFC